MKTNPVNVDFEKRKQLNIQQNKAYGSSVWIAVVTLLMMSICLECAEKQYGDTNWFKKRKNEGKPLLSSSKTKPLSPL